MSGKKVNNDISSEIYLFTYLFIYLALTYMHAQHAYTTSCARGDTICLRPLQVGNIFVFIRQVAVLFRHVGYLRHQQQVDL